MIAMQFSSIRFKSQVASKLSNIQWKEENIEVINLTLTCLDSLHFEQENGEMTDTLP